MEKAGAPNSGGMMAGWHLQSNAAGVMPAEAGIQ
jgi:hypothetical protein